MAGFAESPLSALEVQADRSFVDNVRVLDAEYGAVTRDTYVCVEVDYASRRRYDNVKAVNREAATRDCSAVGIELNVA